MHTTDRFDSLLASDCRINHESRLNGVPPQRKIFVNRNLRLRSLGAMGFDLDHTLANYRRETVDELAFRITQRKLVEKCGYPERLLSLEYDPNFVVRGLVVDRQRGNILKMDYHNYVVRAFHGRRALSTEERKQAYRMRRIRLSSDAYSCVDSPFHTPEAYIYLALIDFFEANGTRPDFPSLHRDIRLAIDEAHADGSIKTEIQREPSKYFSRDPQLAPALRRFREGGKALFLLTNSEYFYTELVLGYLLDAPGQPSWREYFDLVVVDADKPAFFRDGCPAERCLEANGQGAPVFSGGGVRGLEDRLRVAGDSVLYWGDHTYGDILRSKKSVGWRTAMIIPELERELTVTEEIREDLARLAGAIASRGDTEREVSTARLELRHLESCPSALEPAEERRRLDLRENLASLETARREKRHLVADLDAKCGRAYNPQWGMLFREANEISRFGHQVKDFACIYTSRVSNFLHYPRNTYFRAPLDRLPHEL